MYFPDLGVVTPSVGAAHEFTMYKSQRVVVATAHLTSSIRLTPCKFLYLLESNAVLRRPRARGARGAYGV